MEILINIELSFYLHYIYNLQHMSKVTKKEAALLYHSQGKPGK